MSKSFYDKQGNGCGHTGLPSHSKVNQLPKSPKTGILMPFAYQLIGGVKMKHCDIAVTEDYYKEQLKELNCWYDAN
jgi:hypothetical protein